MSTMTARRAAPAQAKAKFAPAANGLLRRKGSGGGAATADAGVAPASVETVLSGVGQPLAAPVRGDMERRFGHDFSTVRIHAGPEAARSADMVAAQAYTVGRDIVFGPGRYAPETRSGRRLIAHELAHVLQQHGGAAVAPGSRRLRRSPFDTAARVAQFSYLMGLVMARGAAASADATAAMAVYKTMPAGERGMVFSSFFAVGGITALMQSLPKKEAADNYVDEVREILRWVEEGTTRAAAGQTDDQMADQQAKFQIAEANKQAAADAAAKAPKNTPAPKPTAAEVEAARKSRVESSSIAAPATVTWDTMDAATKASWTTRADKAANSVVAHATATFPELKLVKADLLADFPAIEKRGVGVLAFAGGPASAPVAVFGYEFVRAAEADPAYVLGVVVHELLGHKEYGAYGSEYHLKLYDLAQTKIPGYTQPAAGTKERNSEIDAYAYQETEIYALLRSMSYSKDIAPKHAGLGLVGYKPADWAKSRIGTMKTQWEPRLAVAMAQGLYQRLLLDPRISGPAINAFRDGVRIYFTALEAKEILK